MDDATLVLRARPLPRTWSVPARLSDKEASFWPTLPHTEPTSAAVFDLLKGLDGRRTSHIIGDCTRLTLVRFRWHVSPQHRIPCVSIEDIEVDARHRRLGHARRILSLMSMVAADLGEALVVSNVVNEHMHILMQQLNGRCLPGIYGNGQDHCHYWLPPKARALRHVEVDVDG